MKLLLRGSLSDKPASYPALVARQVPDCPLVLVHVPDIEEPVEVVAPVNELVFPSAPVEKKRTAVLLMVPVI